MAIFFGKRFQPFSYFKFKDLKPFWTKNLCLISEGNFCVSRDTSNTRYKRSLENNVPSESTISTISETCYNKQRFQYIMDNDSTQVLVAYYNSYYEYYGISKDRQQTYFNSYYNQNLGGTCGDEYIWHTNSNSALYIKKTSDNKTITINNVLDVNGGGYDTNRGIVFQGIDGNYYYCRFSYSGFYRLDLENSTYELLGGSLWSNMNNWTTHGFQQSKDLKYIFSENCYITYDIENRSIEGHSYPQQILDVIGSSSVHHIQALYDNYLGIGLNDGRYLLCYYGDDIETCTVKEIQPYTRENDTTIYHIWLSGHRKYWYCSNGAVDDTKSFGYYENIK